MKHHFELAGTQIEHRRRVARYPLDDLVSPRSRVPGGPKSGATFANGKRQAIGRTHQRVVTTRTGNVPVAAQFLVVKKQLTESDLGR